MEKLEKLLNYVKVPTARDKVYRDECVYTFDSPESEGGLYVDLTTFIGVSQDMLDIHYAKTGNPLYLHLKKVKLPLPKEASAEPEPKVTRLAIGLEGGFSPASKPKYQYEEHNSLFILPDRKNIKMPCPELPEKVQEAIAGILAADTASYKAEVEATEWNGEQRVISKYAADLVQLDNGVKVPPSGWQCQRCDLTTNLWLNLTDGSILCGRKFFDGTGGNNHAVDYYSEKGYPLAVKLGTITSDGKADVYSYPEDDMVEDPFLAKHLSHFGINAATMEKTEKSMAELEVSLNQRIGEWSTIQESGTKLQPLYGPGYTGLQNLGNSCYMNSVLQILFTIPDFQRKYFEGALESFRNSMVDPTEDFNAQTSKVAFGLLSGRYSEQPKEEVEDQDEAQPGVRPVVYKNLIGKGHPEFSTKRQQDAQEFLLHMINLVERHSRGSVNPSDCFKFRIEDRIECGQSRKVRYSERDEYCLPLSVPMDLATNHAELADYERRKQEAESRGEKLEGEPVRPHFTLISLLDSFTQPETVQQFYSTAIKEKTVAYKSTKFATFPDYLAIQLRKFTLTEDWRPVKLDISVSVPEKLDISFLKGRGLQPGEEELPSDVQVPEFTYDPATMQGLLDMGFPLEGCKRSIYFTENKGLEPAAMWAMEHMGDADFDQPFVIPGSATKKKQDEFVPNEEAIAMIEGMGFSRTQAITALKATDNHLERAVDWIFSHPDEVSASDSSVPVPSEPAYRDGPGKYELVAFVSHMGTSTSCGHYVCHIKKDGRWVIFNDNKVALSEHPPIELGYLYFFKRISE